MKEENSICQELEILKKFVKVEEQEAYQSYITGIMEKVQSQAFMNGYRYAITVLKDSIVRKK